MDWLFPPTLSWLSSYVACSCGCVQYSQLKQRLSIRKMNHSIVKQNPRPWFRSADVIRVVCAWPDRVEGLKDICFKSDLISILLFQQYIACCSNKGQDTSIHTATNLFCLDFVSTGIKCLHSMCYLFKGVVGAVSCCYVPLVLWALLYAGPCTSYEYVVQM